MNQPSTYVGLDVHKKDIVVALLLPQESEPTYWTIRNEPRAVRRLAKRLRREGQGEMLCVYEAGPCGYVLQRQLRAEGIATEIAAPSLIPVKPGDRIKTDRRDAKKLATSARSKDLTYIHPPTQEEEAVRDLCRCRADAVKDLTSARHRLSKMLLRRGFVYRQGSNWTRKHRQWLRAVHFENSAARAAFDDYLATVEWLEERVRSLTAQLEEIAVSDPYRDPVGWLRCFRGIDTVTAMTVVAELHDFRRFEDPRKLMAYLGLVPSEHSSAERQRRGSITKAGNSHVRKVLVEASWHYRHRPAVGATLRKRREGQPAEIIAIADKAQRRLYRRFHRLVLANGKPTQKAVVAVARELAGFIWAALYQYPAQQELAA